MEKWVEDKLSEFFDFPTAVQFAKYILQIENERDLEDCLSSLLDYGDSKHKQFATELKKRRLSYNHQIGYIKANDNDNKSNKQNGKKKGKTKGKENAPVQVQEVAKPEKVEKKKTKFVNLFSHGDVLLKGRHRCDCEAKRHPLINNCLICGKIVCAQEGSGPCFFCENLVCSPEQQNILQSKTKQATNLYNKLMDQKPIKDLEDSLKQRDKLLEYDRNSARRTKVIDDDSDYYQSNSIWLSTAEREKLQKQEAEELARKHASRLDRRIAIDFMGRVVIDENQSINQSYNLYSEELGATAMPYNDFENPNICPTIEFDRPTFVEMRTSEAKRRNENYIWNMDSRIIQDKEYLEMSDQGLCLSLHQPYASLLVEGIKTHEGRTWYSSHRGRLWIASAAKEPSAEEIYSIKHSYHILKSEKIKFPETYPTSSLLGCVTVTDVLSQEEYKKLYPEGECDSPYIFICENCYVLPMHFHIKGKHKIYKLDKKLHQAASKCLEKAMRTNKQ